jgi:adenylylsulfate kinase
LGEGSLSAWAPADDCQGVGGAPEGQRNPSDEHTDATWSVGGGASVPVGGPMIAGAKVIEPAVVWLTGLSGAGKSTIALEVSRRLRAVGVSVECLDGDEIRSLFPNTGFTRAERDAHVKRVGFLASRLEHHGVFVVCALISPYAASRLHVRQLCRRFIEVHVATPLAECERRDVKGLYKRARAGQLASFTGLDDPYEPPVTPELRLDTTWLTVMQAADMVFSKLASSADSGAAIEALPPSSLLSR